MNSREISDLEKKLNELLGQYKEEPHVSAISAALQLLRNLDPARDTLKDFLKHESTLSTTLIQLIETRQPANSKSLKGGGGNKSKAEAARTPVGVLDLIYHCLINDVFTRMQVFEIISKICKVSWTPPCVMKILQMSFYFIRYDLDENMSFRLLSLIVNSFVAEDGSLDLVARPVVIQATESLMKSITDGPKDRSTMCIFDFVYDTIVERKNYFASYVLLVIIKHPQVDKLSGFVSFIRNGFFEISLAVLRSPKLEDSVPIYEAVLKVERSFHHAVHTELDSFYSKLDGVESEFLLKFIACLLKVREDIPESIAALLCKIASSIDLYDAMCGKMVRLLEGVVSSVGKRIELSKRLMEVIFPKIRLDPTPDARLQSTKAGSCEASADSLLRACLKHCSENNLREIFEAGLKKCSIKTLTDVCVELKDYMGSSWHIYFDVCKEHNLGFLKDFTRDQINAFITGLSDGNSLGLEIFESGHKALADENNADIFEQLLGKVTDHHVLFAILLKFYSLNAQKRAPPAPLDFLRSFFGSIPEHIADLFSFLGEIIRIIDPRDCWDQIFGILMMDDSFYHEKVQIILYIEQDYLYDLEEKHLQMILYLLEQMMFRGSIGHTSSDVVLNAIFIYKELGKFALTKGKCAVWRDIMNFGVRMVQTQEHSTSEIFLKHLFDFFRIGIDQMLMLDDDLSFANEAVMSKLYAIRDGPKLVSILSEVLQFVPDYSLGIHTVDLISFLSTVICDPSLASADLPPSASESAVPDIALECLKAICKKYRADDTEDSVVAASKYKGKRRDKSKSIGARYGECMYKDDADVPKSRKHIHFYDIADARLALDSGKPDDRDLGQLHTVDTNLINNKVFLPACTPELSEKSTRQTVVCALVAALTYILGNCDLKQYSVISSILQIIPSFHFSVGEIATLSGYLRKFVVLSDPYRTEAIDCFVKTCGSSNGSSHCLKILSSWLSKDSKETSLTLIDKISDRISEHSENNLIDGLVNFIEYSAQFSGSDEFLEPVLNVISKSRPRISDVETFDKLYAFSLKFITEQLNIPCTARREAAILDYLSFFDDLLQEFKSEKYLELLISIIRSNRYYLNLRLKSYEILFESYSFSEALLKSELRDRIHAYSRRFLREGFGISNLLTVELIFCLNQICISRNAELIDSLKHELVDLLVVNDFEIINSVRKSMKILFSRMPHTADLSLVDNK